MILQAWWEPILAPLLGVLGTALAGLLGTLIFRATAWVNRKIGNEKVAVAIERVAEVVDAAVKVVNQNFVDQMKKDGKFDKAAQEKALKEALKITKEMINDEIKQILKENFGNIEEYFIAIIEKTIANIK